MLELTGASGRPVQIDHHDIEGLEERIGLSGEVVTEIRTKTGKDYVVKGEVASLREKMQYLFRKDAELRRIRGY